MAVGPDAFDRWLPTPLLRGSTALHLAGLAVLALAPRQWKLVAATLLADHVLLAAAGMAPRGQLLGPALTRLPPGGADRAVALTFDDGPDPEVTPAVLELLAAAGCTASFFAIGRHAERSPATLAEIVRGGHRVENHTHDHSPAFACHGPLALGREIDRAQSVLTRLAGRRPRWFRAPAGVRNPWLHGVVSGRALAVASWTRRGFDTVSRDPRLVAARLTRDLAAGDVLLLHDRSMSRDPSGRPVVLEALPRVLEALDRQGLRGVALPSPAALRSGAGG